MRRTTVLLVLLPLLEAGCATHAFSLHFRDNSWSDLQQALSGMPQLDENAPRNSLRRPLAFVVATQPPRILAFDLQAKRVMWTANADVTSRIVVGREHIFHREGKGTMVARSIASGEQAWSSALLDDERLVGLTSDGDDVYYVAERPHVPVGKPRAFLVALNGHNGRRKWFAASSEGRLGAPAAAGGRVFAPLAHQWLAVLNAATGTELARVRSKDETILWVRPSSAGVLYGGQRSMYRLDEKAVTGTRRASSVAGAPLPEAVHLTYGSDGYNVAQADYTAYDRNRLLWQVTPGELRFLGDSVFVHNHRFFFGFGATAQRDGHATLRWAYANPRYDVVASTFTGHAIVLVSDHGHMITLDPRTGLPVHEQPLNVAVRGATFDAAGYQSPTTGTSSSANLQRALTQMLWDPDRRFNPVKLLCLEELGRLPGADITRSLLDVLMRESPDSPVYRRAGEILVARRDTQAIPAYLQQLQVHSNFIDGTRAKAVEVLARALGSLKAAEATRPLLLHLADPETPMPAIVEIVRALTAMADSSVVEPFRDFLLTYRCEPSFNEEPAALNLVADALLRLGGKDERQLLSLVANDPHTLQALRAYVQEMLQQKKETPAGGTQAK